MLGSVDNLNYCIRNYPTINPVAVVPHHLASHRCEDLERGCFIVHPFHRRSCGQLRFVENLRLVLVELWSRLDCIVCLIILSLLFLLLFLLLHVVACCYYYHCFLALLALWYWHYCFCRSRTRGRGRCAGHQVATCLAMKAYEAERIRIVPIALGCR